MGALLQAKLSATEGQTVDANASCVVACAQQRKASHVVEAALAFCSSEDQQVIAEELLRSTEHLFALATGQFGRHVVLALLDNGNVDIRKRTTETLWPLYECLSVHKYAKHVCSKLK